jgi:undecaprenyl-diphosphatase
LRQKQVNTTFSKNEKQLLIMSAVALLGFLFVAYFRGSFSTIDLNVNLWVISIQGSPFTAVAKGIAIAFDTTSLVVISIVISAILFFRKHRPESLLLLAAMGGDALLVSAGKTLIRSPRPLDGLIAESGFSFPSGHTAGCIVFCGVLAFFVWQHWRSIKVRVSVGATVGAVSGVVGFSRVFLNVHWFSDVLGAGLLGVFWLALAVLVFKVLQDKGKFGSRRFGAVSGVLFCLGVVVAVLAVAASLIG